MAPPLNNRSAAVVDVILSNHARGYRNLTMISHHLMPRAGIANRSMRVIRFGKESFRAVSSRRAPGANTQRVQYGYASDPVSLVQESLEALVPYEHQQEARKVPGIDLAANAVNMVMDVMDLNLEIEAANLVRDDTKYVASNKETLAGNDLWADPDSDPSAQIDDAKETIRKRIGRYPNTLALGATAFRALKRHPKIKEQFKYTSSDSITVDMLASYFDIEKVVVGSAVWLPTNAAENELASDVWGDDAVLAFVPSQATGNFQVPSFGYTYELNGYPQVEQPYADRNAKSWLYPTTTERMPTITGEEGGFLFKDAGKAAA